MKIVISVGGSVLVPELEDEKIKKFGDVISKLAKEHDVKIVVGGGKIARKYISVARNLNANESFCDQLGIDCTRLNASLLIAALENVYPEPVKSISEALKIEDKVVVMGGTVPGHTTDAVSALLAESWRADLFINATNVDGVYDKDPRKFSDAKKFDKMSHGDLVKMCTGYVMEAGPNVVIDLLAAKVMERSKIKTLVINGSEPENLLNAVGGEHGGTEIS
ncbi:UMP kinase [Candidatus Undinarchaeota archaeon]